jgi:uncharacterized membrane protein
MTKKIVSLIQAIIQAATLAFLFIPGAFSLVVVVSERIGTAPSHRTFPYSFFKAADFYGSTFAIILLIALFVICLAYFVASYISDIPFLKEKFCLAIPCVPILLLIVNTIIITNFYESEWNKTGGWTSWNTEINWGFYVICVLYFCILALEFFKQFSKIPDTKQSKPVKKQNDLEDIEKLKQLLDAGIITQEEFDAKKKQLLGL